MTPSDKEKIAKLEAEADKISQDIDDLYDKRDDIYKSIRKIKDKEFVTTNEVLGIKNGVFVIAVARHQDYHYTMFELFKCISLDKFSIDVLHSKYREDDGDCTFNSIRCSIPLKHFHSMLETYDLYTVTEYSYERLMYSLWRVDINYENRPNFIDQIKSMAISRITFDK